MVSWIIHVPGVDGLTLRCVLKLLLFVVVRSEHELLCTTTYLYPDGRHCPIAIRGYYYAACLPSSSADILSRLHQACRIADVAVFFIFFTRFLCRLYLLPVLMHAFAKLLHVRFEFVMLSDHLLSINLFFLFNGKWNLFELQECSLRNLTFVDWPRANLMRWTRTNMETKSPTKALLKMGGKKSEMQLNSAWE